ncbi:glycosyltransferase family 4 protein [Luteolibacter ambystomatis]|uniref:Glycosyltransferase family 4 protein n=1 Tax=Luteolibacter ambystomatis TaxID=2824561 RepID=A0A975J2J6_9BACT|nr:glycosyltransferase family 4 protein [Luteolibacter ambystomatis]QUE52867.1 glycosyltransferase family 4 protein [Luteolibacter ambystomatis]
MSVVIVHYHLSPGGVTRVVESASRCLTAAGIPHVVLSGSPPPSVTDLPVRVVEGLGYLNDVGTHTPLRLVHAMRSAVQDAIGLGPHVWHFHNHSLGVNPLMDEAVSILAEAGEKLVLQIHDLAEDGRPKNYPVIADSETLYPIAPQIRYAFLNSRDRSWFHHAGLPLESSMVLPNPISAPATPAGNPPADGPSRVLYPVRGIRRKNLGEVFLLAALSPEGTRYAVTLAPVHPRWKPYFDAWMAFSSDSGLPVDLAVVDRISPHSGANSSFEAWLGQATHLVTTSVAEGFGLGYLESAALGKPLLGRNLPMVTQDYAMSGITTGRLYDRVLVPISWVGLETLRQHLTRYLQDVLDAYGKPLHNSDVDRVFDAIRFRGYLDFGNLPEDLQRQVVHRLMAGGDRSALQVEIGGSVVPLATWLEETLAIREPTATPDQLAPYSPDAYKDRLVALYEELEATAPGAPVFLPKHRVLDEYLKPENFNFLLT